MYLQLFLSKRAIDVKIAAAQPNPARNPAVKPHFQSVFASPKKKARLYDITNAIRRVMPYNFRGFDFLSSSSVRLFSYFQAL